MVVYLVHRECYERALEIREKIYGHKHPSVAMVLGNLGNLWKMKGDKAKAISHYQEALAIQEEFLGPNNLKVSHHFVIRTQILQYPMLGGYVSKPEQAVPELESCFVLRVVKAYPNFDF